MTVITLFLSLLSGVVLSRLRGIGHEVQDKVMCIYYSHGINLLDIFSSTEQNTQMQPLLLSSNWLFSFKSSAPHRDCVYLFGIFLSSSANHWFKNNNKKVTGIAKCLLQDAQTSGSSGSDGMCRLENPIPGMIFTTGQSSNQEWRTAQSSLSSC